MIELFGEWDGGRSLTEWIFGSSCWENGTGEGVTTESTYDRAVRRMERGKGL